jgi:hypothetical protein
MNWLFGDVSDEWSCAARLRVEIKKAILFTKLN